ncbi:hypothetical protein A5886_002022 [Enterococcus sp. 8G7_MSG3316]|uniref:HTH lysR-type domain-containing protein n=1 Tax=Candidatus Enterococcus testudinis TaxID=1834191 RepID=A0A242A8K3_9ENTE|nr:LysR family transcriptional regulator [Enterococcus sp. 8G7_MSG3316]OTN76943.1 hypothetical protein A5886_002022 [Enterococcus sp. 8G7_MSG3316]
MKLQQLIYFEKIIEHGSINEAAKSLYLTQPSLSKALQELEEEMKVQLLIRTKQGIVPTDQGREFLIYCRQILDQVNLLEERFKKEPPRKQNFSVSAQHYAFVVHAFVDLIKTIPADIYDFTLRETETENIFQDLISFKSEIGILYLNRFNRQVMEKLFKEKNLVFTPLFEAKPHVFVSRSNPLVAKDRLTLDDLAPYPYLSYEQGETNSLYFSEEILSTWRRQKNIKVSDRTTIFNLMVGLNGYTISSGIISSDLNDDKIIAIPLDYDDTIRLGWVRHQQILLSPIAKMYLTLLKSHIKGYGFDIYNE